MLSKYYKASALFVVLILVLSLVVIIISQHTRPQSAVPVACTMEAKICPDGSSVGRTGPNCVFAECPGAGVSTSTPPVVTPIQTAMITVTQSDMNMTVHLKLNENFIINLGALRWTLNFDPTGIIQRVSDTRDGTGQGIYQAVHSGTTTLHGTGAPICNPGEMCPDFMEAMTITFVVE